MLAKSIHHIAQIEFKIETFPAPKEAPPFQTPHPTTLQL